VTWKVSVLLNFLLDRFCFTAAHCIRYKHREKILQADEFVALIGRYNLERRVEPRSIHADISEVHIHPDWRYLSEKWDADLALLVLLAPVRFSNFIQPVCLTSDARIENYNEGVVVSSSTA
jgi:hypothetical protein